MQTLLNAIFCSVKATFLLLFIVRNVWIQFYHLLRGIVPVTWDYSTNFLIVTFTKGVLYFTGPLQVKQVSLWHCWNGQSVSAVIELLCRPMLRRHVWFIKANTVRLRSAECPFLFFFFFQHHIMYRVLQSSCYVIFHTIDPQPIY